MSDHAPQREQAERPARRVPRGVILIAVLLIAGAFFVGGLGVLVPDQALATIGVPRSLMLVGSLITGLLAYGLLRLRRWAWAATLSFLIVNAYFLLLSALTIGAPQYVGFGLLLLIAAYLLLPSVRAVFWRSRQS
jgi:hypothetical protein